MTEQDDGAATPQASGSGSGVRPKVPQEAWSAGMEAVGLEPRDAAENARTWRVVYHVLHSLGYDCGETWPMHGATPEAVEKVWMVRGE